MAGKKKPFRRIPLAQYYLSARTCCEFTLSFISLRKPDRVPETNPHVSMLISSLNPFCDLPPPPGRPPFDFSKYAVVGERDTDCGVRAFKLSFQNATHTGFEVEKRARDENQVPESTVRTGLRTFGLIPRGWTLLSARFGTRGIDEKFRSVRVIWC